MKLPYVIAAFAAFLFAAEAARGEDAVLVEHVTSVEAARLAEGLIVTASGTVPFAGFTGATLRKRPDLVRIEGGLVLDFMASPPPRDKPVTQVESRLVASFRLSPAEAETVRFVQVRAASGSRTVQVLK